MPITSPASYLPTVDEFIAHWTSANAAILAGGPIILARGVTLANLTTLRGDLASQRAEVESARNEVEGTRADILILKGELLARIAQFRGKIESLSPDSRWTAMLPKAYSISEGMGRVIPPLDALQDMWTRYESAESAITLMGGYDLADFTGELITLKARYTAHTAALNAAGVARGLRDEIQATLYDILKQYRQRIPSEFPEDSAILETLPRLTPLPGSTPPAVQLTATLDTATNQALLTWTPPESDTITTLQVRGSIGPEFDAEDDVLLATLPATGPHTWTGPFGLNAPGTAVAFKVYTLTAEGNEKGSNAAIVTRPA
jgi:hypothetical protein